MPHRRMAGSVPEQHQHYRCFQARSAHRHNCFCGPQEVAAWSTARHRLSKGETMPESSAGAAQSWRKHAQGREKVAQRHTGAMQVASPLSTSTLPPLALCLTKLSSTVPSAGITAADKGQDTGSAVQSADELATQLHA